MAMGEELSLKLVDNFEKLKKYMKFDQEKFFEKNIDSDIDSKKKEIDNSINKQYDVR